MQSTNCLTLDTLFLFFLHSHCFYFSFMHLTKVTVIPAIVWQEITQEKMRGCDLCLCSLWHLFTFIVIYLSGNSLCELHQKKNQNPVVMCD